MVLAVERPDSPLLAVTRSAIGHALTRQGRYQDAELILLAANSEIQSEVGSPPNKARTLQRLVTLYENWGRAAQASRYRKQLDSLSSAARLDGIVLPTRGGQ